MTSKKTQYAQKAINRRARFDYDIVEVFQAGLVLLGSEVKSIRQGRVSLSESFVGEMNIGGCSALFLINSNVAEYSSANLFNHEPKRPRKLLLRKRQMNKLLGEIRRRGMSVVPLSLYFNEKGRIKIDIGLGKGRKTVDKRELLKDRDWNRDKARILKNRSLD